jgi:hypothetical protein
MTNNNDSLRRKVLLLILARQFDNAETACKIMGFSREEYEVLKERYVRGGEAALTEDDHHLHEKADQEFISPQTEQAVLRVAAIRPRLAQSEVASELLKQGVIVSHAAIAKIWKEYGLNDAE